MSVVFEKFSVVKAPAQAVVLHRLIGENLDYVKEFFPGSADRYDAYPKALKNIVRQAAQEAFHPFIIRPRFMQAACGIATIIRNSAVEHPDGTVVQGHNLHFWLDGQHEGLQDETALKLIHESRRLAWTHGRAPIAIGPDSWSVTQEDAAHVYFAALPAEGYNPSVGLTHFMEPLGSPAVLNVHALGKTIIEPSDGLEQIYTHNEILTHRP